MVIPTEPIGSIPRPLALIKAVADLGIQADPSLDSPIDPRIETPEEVRDRILQAAEYIPVEQLGTTDDCGFSPFSDDTSTSRDKACEKIRARVDGTALAQKTIAGR